MNRRLSAFPSVATGFPHPLNMQIFIARPDKSHGPYSLEDVNAYLASGHLSPSDTAWFEGCVGWMPLAQVPGVQLPPGSAAPGNVPPPPPILPPSPQGAPHPVAAPVVPRSGELQAEQTVWEISPTLTPGLVLTVVTFGLWLPVFAVQALTNLGCKYRLTSERLIVTQGVASRRVEEIELYRIKDVTVVQGMVGRMLGFGTVVVHGNDATTPRLSLHSVNNPVGVKEGIRERLRVARRTEGVRAVEYGPGG